MRTTLLIAILVCAHARADEPHWANEEAHRLAEQATVLHKQAQQEKSEKKYEQAHALYQKYLASYPDVSDAQLSYFDAELLFTLKRYAEAAKMYERVFTIAPNGKYAAESAYAYVLSATNNAINEPDSPGGGAPCPSPAPCALSPDRKRVADALERYLTLVPQSKERPAIEYRLARLWYGHNQLDKASPLFEHIFASYPDHELATYSANLAIDCLVKLKRYGQLSALVERVKKSPAMRDEAVRQSVEAVDAALGKQVK